MRKDRINYDIEPDLHQKVMEYAKKTNLSRNQVLSEAVRFWIENKKEGK